MMTRDLAAMWTAVAAAMGNHLWQSTLFAAAAGLLTLALHKNHARVRYWLWLAASLKFLIPFSLLVGMGNHMAWSRADAPADTGLYVAVEQVGQPFTRTDLLAAATHPAASPGAHFTAILLVAAWLCGFLCVVAVWLVRWRRISALLRKAAPVHEGREVEILRRLERNAKPSQSIEMLRVPASLEPGIFGVLRPVLLWPEGISARLEDAHLEAILAHELRHVRRRDNLAAAIHMVVEAIFWFHPLVWWLGARLVEERERSCDEEVLQLGSERKTYAESILKVCEFCVESPLACVSGVAGADLKRRMVHIMTENVTRKLDFTRRLLLSTAGILAIVLPVIFGLFQATPGRAQAEAGNVAAATPGFQVTSIKADQQQGKVLPTKILVTPDGINLTGITVKALVHFAYGVDDQQISGGPDWMSSARYDIATKTDKSVADEIRGLGDAQKREANQRILQSMLADQFKLRLHPQTENLPIYELTVAAGGPKLQESKGMGMMRMGRGELTSQGTPLALLVEQLSLRLGRTVVDKTGLSGDYAFTLHWTPDANEDARLPVPAGMASPEVSGPPLIEALQDQLGLALQPASGPVQILVIDHVDKPADGQ